MRLPGSVIVGYGGYFLLADWTLHELSLTENVLQIIEDAAQHQKFSRVKIVWLEIGLLACVRQESLRFYFDVITQDTIAHQAQLKVIEVAGLGWCEQCTCEVPLTTRYDPCTRCGQYGLKIIRGEEMRVKELEVT
ncbi:MAG: putative hydrogenase nickel incorporation protein HypA 2 [Nitrosomonas sp.]|nr:MAG: putative hydrogenase nickel incorporation protein HypA 2 [Nitrosomonas sp.]